MDLESKAISDDKRLIGQAIATREHILDKLVQDANVIDVSESTDIDNLSGQVADNT